MKSLMARANEACLHRKYDDFTAFLMASSNEASILAQNIAETDLRAHITTEVESRLLSAMRAITAEELALKAQGKASEEEAPNLFEATSLAKRSCSAVALRSQVLLLRKQRSWMA